MTKKTREVKIKAYSQWVLLCFAFVVTIFCIGISPYGQNEEIVQVGDVAAKRYVAQRDTVDAVATEKLKTAAANSIGPIYKNDITVEENSTKQVNDVFQELNDLLLRMKDGDDFYQKVKDASLKLPVVLNNRQLTAYRAMPLSNRILFAEDAVDILNQIYSEGLSADELEQGKTQVKTGVSATPWSEDLKGMAYTIVSAALDPNLVLDEETMEALKEEKRQEVSDVLIRKNQKIVDEGEIITQDIFDRLVALKLLGDGQNSGRLLPFLGSTGIVVLLFGAVGLFFHWSKGRTVLKKNEIRMLFCIYVLLILFCRAMSFLPYYTLLPFSLFAMLTSLLIGRRMALLMNCFYGVIACMIFSGDAEFLTYSLISGSFGALLIQRTEKRSFVVPVAVGMAAVSFVTMLSVGLFFRDGYTTQLAVASALGALMGLISVVIAVGSLPFWESVFEANTPLRLLELTNPSNELLRKLMIEAPGTYHHSLIVANLAETAVYEIGGNTALARAGAYYHDVGKLKYPMFFAENQTGHNPHNDIDPKSSARIITQHTTAGVEMGKEYGLPKAILAMMTEHQGTTLVKYFYFKALKEYGAENVNEAEYRYGGPIPQSRESAVIMLADTVEAAVRSMLGNGKTLDEVEGAIHTLIKDKLDDGQLNHSGLGIHELEKIEKAFLKVFHGMYHERVSYPKKEEIEAASRKVEIEKEEKNSDDTH